jgi:penicillin-binding protein 1A
MARKSPSRWARALRRLTLGTLFVIALVTIVSGVILWDEITTDLPPVEDILNYRPPTSTRVFADDGTQIGEFFFERRYLVSLDRIPPLVRAAFVAGEDANFYRHTGIDLVSIVRAFLRNMQSGGVVQGASTITQQVVKSLLLSPERSYRRKLREIVLSFRLERHLSKDEILYLYLNQIYFGNGAYGVAAAARSYFGKDVEALSLAEGAMLAGLVQAPSRYSPVRHPQRAKARQRYVLERMQDEHFITAQQRVAVLQEDVILADAAMPTHAHAPYYVEYVRRVLQDRYGGRAPYQMGLNVYTTVNLQMQAAAEEALRHGLEELQQEKRYSPVLNHIEPRAIEGYLQRHAGTPPNPGELREAVVTAIHPESAAVRVGAERGMLDLAGPNGRGRLALTRGDIVPVRVKARDDSGWLRLELDNRPPVEGALLAIEPGTGYVKAMVGGYDFYRSEFNRAVQSERQPGSAFKPLIYAAALDHGYTPSSLVFDGPIELPNGNLPAWAPRNYNDRYFGWTTLRNALVHSLNTVTVRVVDRIGLGRLLDTLKDFRVFRHVPPRNLSIALGTAEVSLLKMTQAFSVFATLGERPAPIFISRIEDGEGRLLEAAQPISERVLAPATAYLVTSMLQSVVERGTARRALDLGRPCAGKTGTTNDFRDAWFIGFTPDLVAGVWVGFDSKRSLGEGSAGGRIATPIWTTFMEKALEGRPILDFQIPPEVTFVNVDEKTGLRAVAGRPSVLEVFRQGTEPVAYPRVEEPPPPPEPEFDEPGADELLLPEFEIEDIGFTN